jgi:hypothetical protein
MSALLEQLNAEYQRIEKAEVTNCCSEAVSLYLELKKDIVNLQKNVLVLQGDIIYTYLVGEFLRLQDMHDFIYSNPTLKGDMKELTFKRYLEIYKENHKSLVEHKFDHDGNPLTEELSLADVINLMGEVA